MSMEVGMIGLGIMGSAMSANLVRDGATVIGCDIDREKTCRTSDKCIEIANYIAQTGTEDPSDQSDEGKIIELIRIDLKAFCIPFSKTKTSPGAEKKDQTGCL